MTPRELMSGVDAAWLHMDRPENTADVVALMAFRERLTLDEVRRVVEERVVPHPRFRQRIVQDGVLGLSTWEDDPRFDLSRHLVERTVHAKGHGDDEIVARTRAAADDGQRVAVVSADRALQARVAHLGATPLSPGWLLDQL